MKIGIIVAMDKEFTQLKTLIDESDTERHNHKDFVIGNIGNNRVIMQQCGIGKVNSAIGTVELINNFHPDIIISTGCAGGADISLNVLDVVVSTECTYHDAYCGSECEFGQVMGMPARYHSPKELIEKALAINELHPELHIKAGHIVSGEWFVDSKDKMKEILEHFPNATAVDMESCSIAQTCHIYKTPFISFRIISDVPLKDNKAAQYFDFWSKMAEGSFNVTKSFLEAL
nr:5'-methylthioadenosine/adenosylhomocysteine nucleosidase [Prevotella sp.]